MPCLISPDPLPDSRQVHHSGDIGTDEGILICIREPILQPFNCTVRPYRSQRRSSTLAGYRLLGLILHAPDQCIYRTTTFKLGERLCRMPPDLRIFIAATIYKGKHYPGISTISQCFDRTDPVLLLCLTPRFFHEMVDPARFRQVT